MQEDYEAYKCPYNPFISVEVSNPVWSHEGATQVPFLQDRSHRLYKIVVKLRENPEFPCIQVHRRYSDLEWLIKALQVRYPACVVPPIPPKLPLGFYYKDDSPEILERKEGI